MELDFSSIFALIAVFLGVVSLCLGFRETIQTKTHRPDREYRLFLWTNPHKCICGIHFPSAWAQWWHIYYEWFDGHFNCRCRHAKSEHTGQAGPNSIGQYFHGQCTHDSVSIGPYRVGGCDCTNYRRRLRTAGRRLSIREQAKH